MPENVKLHPHENCNCDRDGVALPPEIVLEVKNLTKKFQVDGGKVLTAWEKRFARTAEKYKWFFRILQRLLIRKCG